MDDGARVQPAQLGEGVQFVEKTDAQSQIGVGKQLDGLGLAAAGHQQLHVLFLCPLLQKPGESVRLLRQHRVGKVRSHDNAAGIEVIVQSLPLPEEFRTDQNMAGRIFGLHGLGEAHGNRALNDHDGLRRIAQHLADHRFHHGGVECIFPRIEIGGHGDDHIFSPGIAILRVQSGPKPQMRLIQIRIQIAILDGRNAPVEHVHLLRRHIHHAYGVMLSQQHCLRQPHIAHSGNCNFHV